MRTTDLAGSLKAVLTSPAVGTVQRFAPGKAGVRFAAGLARRPRALARNGQQLTGELAKVTTGASRLAPSPQDRRFSDQAWRDNPLLRRVLHAYLAGARSADALLADAGLTGGDADRIGFLVENLVEAASPSNNPLINPLAWKAFVDTGGRNAVSGVRNLLGDLRSAPRVPAMVDSTAFEVGANLATTPGEVVLRTELFELIQYAPQTETVRERPVLLVPPTINSTTCSTWLPAAA
jgi:polyhydroxyalkanoate synthase